jgi:hypothetical protein
MRFDLARGYMCRDRGCICLGVLVREKLSESLWLGRDSKMLLDVVQPRSVSCEHAIEQVKSFDKLFEDLFRRKVFSHLLS